jgi:glycosyltransferase involved in cell wall biosynthesis
VGRGTMKKKVLIVGQSLVIGGGYQRIAAAVASGLKEKDYDVTVLTFLDRKPRYDFDGEFICLNQKKTLNIFLKIKKIVDRPRNISKICKEKEIDVVISFLHDSNFPNILSKILFFNKAKLIVSVRNNALYHSFLKRSLEKILYPKADLVVALSRGVEHILNNRFKIKNTTTIYNLQNVEQFIEKGNGDIEKKHKNIYDGSFVFINVGRLTEQKAHWNLIRAFKKVSDKNEKAKIIIRGSGKLEQKLQELINKLNLNNKVFLIGKVENIFPYYKKANCFVLSSNYEGFGNVLTEALAQNTSVISTDCISGPREILCPELDISQKIKYPYYGRYGILVEPMLDGNDFSDIKEKPLTPPEEKLADVMIAFAKDETLSKKYKNGLERAKDFNKNKIIVQWEEII